MVKPHSPIVQCRTKPFVSTQTSKGRNNDVAAPGPSRTINTHQNTQGLGSQQRTTRRVTFSKTVMVKETLHINNMSEKARNQYWLTEEEQIAVKTYCQQCIQKMTSNDPDIDNDESDFCSRGLECRTREGTMERNKRKQAARRAVLLQVQLQQDEGIHDPHFIAAVSITKTKASAELAHQLALRDAAEASSYLRDAKEAWTYLYHELLPRQSAYQFY